jgi:hypothetical protein
MNNPEQPLRPETLDELLSADIDGEFERAAEELGFTPDGARAALEASPDAGPRRDALVQARDLLASSAALETDDQARLVTAALASASDQRRASLRPVAQVSTHRFRNARRALVGIGTAAAVIAGVVALSANNPSGQSKSSLPSAAKRAANAPAMGAAVIDAPRSVAFGAVTPPGAFHLKVRAQLAQQQKTAPVPTSTADRAHPPLAVESPDSIEANTRATGTYNATAGAAAQRLDCIALLERTGRGPSAPVLSGSGTKGTEPVFVVVYRQAKSYLVYVLSAADCSVVSRDTLP